MPFITKATESTEAELPINNGQFWSGSFWPAIDPAKVRATQKIDSTVTSERLRDVLIEAIATVNSKLANWRITQIAAGHDALEEVPAEEIDDTSINVHRYCRAVGCIAKASLIERYRDFDTTAAGNKKADQLENPIDDLRRDARWAISDILGIGRSVVELI